MSIRPTSVVLVIDDEKNMLHMLSASLQKEGYEVVAVSDGSQGLAHARERAFDFILCDLKMPKMDGLQFLAEAKLQGITGTIIMMSAFATVETAVTAMKIGAYDFITKPFKIDEILCIFKNAEEREQLKKENRQLLGKIKELEGRNAFQKIIGESKTIRDLSDLIEKAAKYDTTVLITGESGTGKELVAEGIRSLSARAKKPFVTVNCGSIPGNLLESEFFGYLKGAFTGADSDKKGLFEEADGGTVLLDEIGELPLELQVKLLRVLQEREIRPLGDSKNRKVDVRVIAATARNLEEEIEKGKFRQDLYYRLNVVHLHIPPLRERKEDIPLLCEHFLRKYCSQLGSREKNIAKETLRHLLVYNWPGNVRELENYIQRSIVISEQDTILPTDLPPAVVIHESSFDDIDNLGTYSLKQGKILLEKKLIKKALAFSQGNKSQAALMLEISYPSLLSKIKELRIT